MKKKFAIVNAIILFALVGLIAVLTTSFAHKNFTQSKVPDFSFNDLNDHKASLYSLDNRKVIVHFWATWCPPCRDEMPDLLKKASQMKGTTFLLVSADRDKKAIPEFFKHQKLVLTDNVTLIHDGDGTIAEGIFKVDGLPETIILGKDKTIAQRIYGEADWRKINE